MGSSCNSGCYHRAVHLAPGRQQLALGDLQKNSNYLVYQGVTVKLASISSG